MIFLEIVQQNIIYSDANLAFRIEMADNYTGLALLHLPLYCESLF